MLWFISFLFLSVPWEMAPLMKRVEELKGVTFQKPVQVKIIHREELEAFLEDSLRDTYPEGIDKVEAFYKALHLIPPDLPLKETLMELYKEQAAAFYNPKDKTFYVIQEVVDQFPMVEMFIIHELTHALQDQILNLYPTMKKMVNNHDKLLAFQAILEGEATLLMIKDQLPKEGMDQLDLSLLQLATPALTDMVGDFPPYLVHQLVFPYLAGADYLNGKNLKGKAIYQHIPRSTEELIHKKVDPPTPLSLRNLPTPPGWHLVYQDTLGEGDWTFMGRQVWEEAEAKKGAEGWDGDRVGVYQKGRKTMVVWLTFWDSPQDAKEGAELLKAYLQTFKDRVYIHKKGKGWVALSSHEPLPKAWMKRFKEVKDVR